MDPTDIELVLAFEGSRVGEIRDGLDALVASGHDEDARLAELERRLGASLDECSPSEMGEPEERASDRSEQSWDDLIASARANLETRGVDVNEIDLAALMNSTEAAEVRRVATSTKPFRCRLDATDLVIATLAGVAAAAVDITIVKIPKTMKLRGQEGSPLTSYLRGKAVPTDNWIGELAKVPFDSLNADQPEAVRLSPRTHRADTFGHDPFLGLVFGVIDILRGTSTGVGRTGDVFVRQIADPTTHNPLVALVIELAHLLSDVGTKAGLPLPGWSILRMINAGSIEGLTIGDQARLMYLRGFDSWHLITMSTSVAAAELVLRGGWAIRGAMDADWSSRCDDEARMAGTTRTASHPRFLMMSLLAHGIATAANAGKIAAAGGNPLAWNAAQWARFAQLVTAWWEAQPWSAADAIATRSDINLERLLEGWPT